MANNANVNKVVYGNDTLIDLTSDTVAPEVLMQGYTAHDRSGAAIVGTATSGGQTAPDVLFTGSIATSASGGTTLAYSVSNYDWLEFTFKDDSGERFYSQRLKLADGLKTSLSYVFNASSIAYIASVDVRVADDKLFMGNNNRLQVAFNGSAHVSASNMIYITGVYGYTD